MEAAMARKFFYVCAGLLCLALAYHLGARSATAQAPGNSIVAAFPASYPLQFVAVTANGDFFGAERVGGPWVHYSNVFSGPTPANESTFGQLKARYR
jgi:hypothetical protein